MLTDSQRRTIEHGTTKDGSEASSQQKYQVRRNVKAKIMDTISDLVWIRQFPEFKAFVDAQMKLFIAGSVGADDQARGSDSQKEPEPSETDHWPTAEELEELPDEIPDLDPADLVKDL